MALVGERNCSVITQAWLAAPSWVAQGLLALRGGGCWALPGSKVLSMLGKGRGGEGHTQPLG